MRPQHEITRRGALLAPDGDLKQRGFAKRPVLVYNPENTRVTPLPFLDRLRLKEWDYYGTTAPDFFFSVCISHIGYMGLVFAYYIDFREKRLIAKELPTPLGAGVCMPRSSETGDVAFSGRGVEMRFTRAAGRRHLTTRWKNFTGGRDLEADLELVQPDEDSIVMVTPMEKRHFYYNHKVNCMPTTGRVKVGAVEHVLPPRTALTTLDWGRGAWPYRTFWNWASASGYRPGGRRIGLNLGSGFGDLSAATENCVVLEGKMTKYGWVDIQYDPGNYMKPWRFLEEDGRLDLTLTPFFDRTSQTNLLVAGAEGHQMFGNYNGRLKTDDGEELEVRNLIGWAEEHRARW